MKKKQLPIAKIISAVVLVYYFVISSSAAMNRGQAFQFILLPYLAATFCWVIYQQNKNREKTVEKARLALAMSIFAMVILAYGSVSCYTAVKEQKIDRWYSVEDFSEGRALVNSKAMQFEKQRGLPGLYGYLDENLGIATPIKYIIADSFSEGVAAVFDEEAGWHYIDRNGDTVLTLDPTVYTANSFYDNLAKIEKEDKYYFIDKKGNIIIDGVWDGARSFSDGMAIVRQNEREGAINTEGELVIPCVFEKMGSFHDGRASVAKDNKWGFVDQFGTLICDYIYDDVMAFSEGRAAVKIGTRWSFIDTSGAVVTSSYPYVDSFSEGLAWVVDDDNHIGYINPEGELVLDFYALYGEDGGLYAGDYSEPGFREGYAPLVVAGDSGFINKSGEVVIDASENNDACTYLTEGYLIKRDPSLGMYYFEKPKFRMMYKQSE